MAFVYVFKTGPRHFKIGRTKDLDKRRKDLSTGNPNLIELVDFIETDRDSLVENFLQKQFYAFICGTGDSTEHYEIESLDILENGMKEAREFLKEYLPTLEQSKQYSSQDPTEGEKKPTDEIKELFQKLRSVKGKAEILDFEREYLENQLKVIIGLSEGIEGMVTWKSQTRTTFAQSEFKNKYPELFKEYAKETKNRTFRYVK